MENTELFRLLEIPEEVEKQLVDYGNGREWDEGIKEIRNCKRAS